LRLSLRKEKSPARIWGRTYNYLCSMNLSHKGEVW
jgi:hypothetical protein